MLDRIVRKPLTESVKGGLLFFGLITILPSLIFFTLRGSPPPRPEPRFNIGQSVRTIVGDLPGMVVGIYCPVKYHNCGYYVRVPMQGMQYRTHTRLFGSDDPITAHPITILNLQEYELRGV